MIVTLQFFKHGHFILLLYHHITYLFHLYLSPKFPYKIKSIAFIVRYLNKHFLNFLINILHGKIFFIDIRTTFYIYKVKQILNMMFH